MRQNRIEFTRQANNLATNWRDVQASSAVASLLERKEIDTRNDLFSGKLYLFFGDCGFFLRQLTVKYSKLGQSNELIK